MATRIRLRRVGRKGQVSFRIVVAGSIHARQGRISETIGKYNPRIHPSYIEIDEKRALFWLRQGAEMSESVGALFRKAGVLKKLADGVEGEEKVVIGDPEGQTVLAGRPVIKVEAPIEEEEAKQKPAKAKAVKAKAAKAKKAKPEAEAEAEVEAKAEAEAEAEPKVEAEAEVRAEAEVEADAQAPEAEPAAAEPEAQTEQQEEES